MRATFAILALASATAHADPADPTPVTVRGETIVIEGHAPAGVPPRLEKRERQRAPHYSDYAILHDTWTRAWVLLDIDEHGDVARMKMLKHPGADLELYAVDHAFGLHFAPARDGAGHAVRSQLVTSIEWPSYWYMIDLDLPPTRIPDEQILAHVPCAGSGPMHLGSLHPGYRDCSKPDLTRIAHEPWITHSKSR